MHHDAHEDRHGDEDPRLYGKTAPATHAQKKECFRESGEGIGTTGQGLRESAVQRVGAQRHDQRREAKSGNQCRIESTPQSPQKKGPRSGGFPGEPGIAPQQTESHRAQPQQGSYRQIDAAGEDNRQHHQGEQTDLHRMTDQVRQIVRSDEIASCHREKGHLQNHHAQENRLMASPRYKRTGRCRTCGGLRHRVAAQFPHGFPFRRPNPSATTANRMMPP